MHENLGSTANRGYKNKAPVIFPTDQLSLITHIYLLFMYWPEREARVKEEYLAEHGTMAGLQIIRTRIPEPAPLPKAYRQPER